IVVLDIVAALELLEDMLDLICGDARPRIPDLDFQRLRTPTTADSHAPRSGVAHGIGEEILQYAAQQAGIAVHPATARQAGKIQPAFMRQRLELRRQRRQHLADGESLQAHIPDRKSTRLNSSHVSISYAVF